MSHCDEALKSIGEAIAAYRRNAENKNPPRLETLIERQMLSAWTFVCPASGTALGEVSYRYRGGDLHGGVPGEMVLAYDKEACHKGRRNVLFADGEVKRMPEKLFEKSLERDNELRGELGLERIL